MRAGWTWRGVAAIVTGSLVAAAASVLVPQVARADVTMPIAPSWITTTGRTERVRAMTKLGNTVYVGGEFTAIAPAPSAPTIRQSYLFAVDATTGVYKPEFAPVITSLASDELDPNGVLALEVDPATNTLFVGGRFTSVDNQPLTTFAVLDATTGALKAGVAQPSVTGGSKAEVNAIYRVGSQLYVGGGFDHVNGTARANVARFDLGAGLALDNWEAPVQGGIVHVFAVDPSAPQRVYIGGRFTSAGPASNVLGAYLAAFDTSATNTLLNWFPQPDGGDKPGWVLGLDALNGRVYAGIAGGGGQFNVYNGTPGVTKLMVKQIRANGNVQAVKVLGNKVYFGGHYDYLTSPSYPLGKLNAYTLDTLQPDPTFKVRLSGVWGVFAIMGTSADDLWAGGEIVSANATDTNESINVGDVVHLRTGEVADTTQPSPPGRPTVTNGVFTSLKVSWTPGSDDRFISAYEIFAGNSVVAVAAGTATSAVVTGLPASQPTSITVRSLDSGRNLSQSSPATVATTGVGPPTLPSPLKGYGELYPVNPSRVLDTRVGIGGPASPVQAGVQRDVQVTGIGEVPATGVGMVALNVTVTAPSAPGFLTVYPGGEAPPPTSNLNFRTGQTVPNFVLARVPASGIVSLALSAGNANVLVDVVGWFGSATAPTPGAKITAESPVRVLDTRQPGFTKVGQGESIEVPVATAGSGVNGVVLNVTATQPTTTSFVTVYPADQASPPNASNLNVVAGDTRPNMVIVKVPTTGPSAGKIKLYNAFGSTHLIVDVMATFKATTAFDNKPVGRLLPLTSPVRLIDTRREGGPLGAGQVASWDLRAVDDATPANISGIVANATATQATAPTFLTLYPSGTSTPNASNLNVVPGADVPNSVVVGLSASDALSVFNAAGSVQYIVDVSALVIGA